MQVEEAQSRSASVVHLNGQNMSAAQTTAAAVPGSIASFFGSCAQTTFVPNLKTMTRMLKKWPRVVWGFRRLMSLLWTDVVAAKYFMSTMGCTWYR